MGLTSSQEDANQNVEATTVEETSTPTSPSGRQQLRISQGVVPPSDEEKFENLLRNTEFSISQIQKIMQEFGSHNYQHQLDREAFGQVMERLGLLDQASKSGFERSHLVSIFFDMFDENEDGKVSFFEFVHGVAVLLQGDVEEKAKMFFRMYDTNHDGKITRRDMAEIVRRFLQSSINYKKTQYKNMAKYIGEQALAEAYDELGVGEVTEEQVNEIVESAFEHADTNMDNTITLDEFINWVKHSKAMKLQMRKLGFRFPTSTKE